MAASDPQPHPIAAITKTEMFDADVMHGLSKHEGIPFDIKKLLKTYRKKAINGNRVPVSYMFGKNLLSYGRISPAGGLGLASLRSDIRSALAAKYYIDIDMANAQPVLLIQMCKQRGWLCPCLEDYVANRAHKLAELQEALGCDRAAAKEFCLTILFGAGIYKKVPDYYIALAEELVDISKKFIFAFPEIAHVTRNRPKPLASCLANAVQTEESKVLIALDSFLSSRGYPLEVLIHDGGLVRKHDGLDVEALMREAEAHLVTKGWNVRLEQKPLVNTFVFEDSVKELPASTIVDDRYAAEQFVKLCGDQLVRAGCDVYVLKEDGRWGKDFNDLKAKAFTLPLVWQKAGAAGPITYNYQGSNKNVKAMLENVPILAKVGKVPFQFAFQFADVSGNKTRILELVDEMLGLLANGNAEVKSYITNYLAHMVQKPHELPGTTLIFTGEKGCGKDTLFDFIGTHVIGSDFFINYAKTALIFQKHDTLRANKVMIKLEEANRTLCLENDDILKPMITASTMQIEPKNQGVMTLPNCTRMIFTTNSGCPVNFTSDERRFSIQYCSSARRGDSAFWTEVRDMLFNDGAGAVVGEWLMSIDISGWVSRAIPVSDYQAGIVEAAVSPLELFIGAWDGGELDGAGFYNAYRQYCQDNALPYKQNMKSLGIELLAFLTNGKVKKRRTAQGMFYSR